jgi:hypothetical protein
MAHFPHSMHLLASIRALRSTIDIAFWGHSLTQLPHPMHFSLFIQNIDRPFAG